LRMLELGSNKIRAIGGLDRGPALESLWLGRNKIAVIEGLSCLAGSLRRLSIQSNRLTEIGSGLSALTGLEELYLSHNALTSMAGVEALTRLRVLDLAANRITKLQGVERITQLKEFWVRTTHTHTRTRAHASSLHHVPPSPLERPSLHACR
jgi:Leucine-rich repeat (LRR) protein